MTDGLDVLQEGGRDGVVLGMCRLGDISGDYCDAGEVGARDCDGMDAVYKRGVSGADMICNGFVDYGGYTTVAITRVIRWGCVEQVVIGVVAVEGCLVRGCEDSHLCKAKNGGTCSHHLFDTRL